MRFFLEFVSCCGSPRSQEAAPAPAGNPAEEIRALVGQRTQFIRSNSNNCGSGNVNDNSVRKKKRRGRVGNGSEEWKPSLGSISENHVAVAAAAEEEAKRPVKRRGEGGVNKSPRDMASIAAFYEESRGSNSFGSSAMPGFAACPFMM